MLLKLCKQLNVAISGYLAHSYGRPNYERKQQDQQLLVHIRADHARGRGIYGPIKIQYELAAKGEVADINHIKSPSILHGIRCTHKKECLVTTILSSFCQVLETYWIVIQMHFA